jgi:ribosomal protein S18 acetylase RimI-like enzyme
VGLHLSTELRDDAAEILELEFAASEPYTRFVFSTPTHAQAVRQYLFDRNLGEFSRPYLRILRDTDDVVGMLAVLTGTELVGARLRAAVALRKSDLLAADAGVADRLQLAGRTLLKVQPDEFYISRIAVAQAARGRGLGERLLQEAEREAIRRGCARLVLEVAPESAAARRLYERERFTEIAVKKVVDPVTGRSLEYVHLAKSLDVPAAPPTPASHATER